MAYLYYVRNIFNEFLKEIENKTVTINFGGCAVTYGFIDNTLSSLLTTFLDGTNTIDDMTDIDFVCDYYTEWQLEMSDGTLRCRLKVLHKLILWCISKGYISRTPEIPLDISFTPAMVRNIYDTKYSVDTIYKYCTTFNNVTSYKELREKFMIFCLLFNNDTLDGIASSSVDYIIESDLSNKLPKGDNTINLYLSARNLYLDRLNKSDNNKLFIFNDSSVNILNYIKRMRRRLKLPNGITAESIRKISASRYLKK